MELSTIICYHLLVACILINVMSIGSSSPYGLDIDNYNLDDINDSGLTFDDVPVKRGMCRYGFTYQSVLRKCLPSLGALRSRARGGRRGRRGMSWSRYYSG